MRHSTTTLEALALLCLFLLGLAVAEYLLLFHSENTFWQSWLEAYPWLIKLQTLLFKLGYLWRVGGILSYTGLVYIVMKARLPESQGHTANDSKARFWILSFWVSCFTTAFVMSPIFSSVYLWLFPLSLLSSLILVPFWLLQWQRSSTQPVYRAERRKKPTADSLHIRTRQGYVNILNPYRGTLVMGSSGSGKSESIGNNLLSQFIQQGYCGVVYDFKFPTLAEVAHQALLMHQQSAKADHKTMPYFILNFQDLSRSHRCNPLSPENISTLAHAEEYARTIVSNLDRRSIQHPEFFSTSATAWLAALIWFFRTEHPHFSTLPHVINAILYPDYTQVISMLETNPQSADMIRSIATAIQNKAEKQLAGVIASLQIMVSRINSPEIAWVLSGEDFNFRINDPADPKLLCIGADPGLSETLSPVISLIITVALKQMNQQGQHKSFILLDEAPTLYIPRFEVIPATARSNRIASVFMAQDFSQMQDMFGREKAAIIVANLSNQFFGKASTLSTAKTVSEMLGSQAQWQTHFSRGNSRDSKGRHNLSYNTSHSLQERVLVKPQEIMQLSAGEFVGRTVESRLPYFRDQVRLSNKPVSTAIQPFTEFDIEITEVIEANFLRIRDEVQQIVRSYPNVYPGL